MTGVQTCGSSDLLAMTAATAIAEDIDLFASGLASGAAAKLGRASCRERV